ncbi:aminotransferase class I/II-fold pyridoxal phosphate-dependent enzyme [Spongiimicrobium sp. 3-5]|uniref:aminotransferase class I/II-fold pyridoxal phosphate-dependent enzyme n=1 Tax=Spongiimicrobium sp. 3-5 TaxID=3332596 RepID=UPI00397FA688
MRKLPKKLKAKLTDREAKNALRTLQKEQGLVDFSSNDYLGFAKNNEILDRAGQWLAQRQILRNGATGSRLLSGNHAVYEALETSLCSFHKTEAALVFNSGYDANLGFFSAIPQRGDVVFYDEYIHASIRDGLNMGNAKKYKFKHNDLADLKAKISSLGTTQLPDDSMEIYVVTEAVFSMDGDSPELLSFVEFCEENNHNLVVDEAHSVGVFGANGSGMLQQLGLHRRVFASIVTFGKALGVHGAAVLGCKPLKSYLVNFARSLIYTTAMPPHSVASIIAAYEYLQTKEGIDSKQKLHENIAIFNQQLQFHNLQELFVGSNSAIQCCILSGNEKTKAVALRIQGNGFDVRPILSPTVPIGEERLRFCLHSYNTEKEIKEVVQLLANFNKKK